MEIIKVVKKAVAKEIRVPGKVVIYERKTASIFTQFPGKIEQIYADFTGQQVA